MSQKSKEVDIDTIKRAWLLVLETMLNLKQAIRVASINFSRTPDCLILAQKLNNQFDCFEAMYGIPNALVSSFEFRAKKDERDSLYRALYKIFDKITTEEIVQYIQSALQDSFIKYKMYVNSLKDINREDIIKMLEIRDRVKYLYDELDIWTGRWKGGGAAEACDIKEKLCQQIFDYDSILKDFFRKHRKEFKFITLEAKKRLVPKPDGSRRFNFWWWHMENQNLKIKNQK